MPAIEQRNPTGVISVGARVQFGEPGRWRDGVIIGPDPDYSGGWLVRAKHAIEDESIPWYWIRLVYHPGATRLDVDQWLASYGGARCVEWPDDYTPPPPPFVRVRPVTGINMATSPQYGAVG